MSPVQDTTIDIVCDELKEFALMGRAEYEAEHNEEQQNNSRKCGLWKFLLADAKKCSYYIECWHFHSNAIHEIGMKLQMKMMANAVMKVQNKPIQVFSSKGR
jgi:hypothetical protein